jgi:hypothetical protein
MQCSAIQLDGPMHGSIYPLRGVWTEHTVTLIQLQHQLNVFCAPIRLHNPFPPASRFRALANGSVRACPRH